MKRRLLCILMCAVMLAGIVPAVSAEENVITSVEIYGVPTPVDGAVIPFDNDCLAVSDPDLYDVQYWAYSWSSPAAIYMPTEYDTPVFVGGETYTLMLLVIPHDGVTGLDETTADTVPVYINGVKATYNPECKPMINDNPENIYAYQIEISCPWTEYISIVDVLGFVPPTPGAAPCEIGDLSVPAGAPYSITDAQWVYYTDAPGGDFGLMEDGETFEAGKCYYITISISCDDGYDFAYDIDWRFNGTGTYADRENSRRWSQGGRVTMYCEDLICEARHVDTIRIDNMGVFCAGNTALSVVENATLPAGAPYDFYFIRPNINVVKYSDNTYVADDSVLLSGEKYLAVFRIAPVAGWYIDNSTVWYINGKTSNVLYAEGSTGYWFVKTVPADTVDSVIIDEVYIHGATLPFAGETAQSHLYVFTTGEAYDITDAYWFCDSKGREITPDEVFEEGERYSLCVCTVPREGCKFSDDVKFIMSDGIKTDFSGYSTKGHYYAWTVSAEARKSVVFNVYLSCDAAEPAAGIEIPKGSVYGLPAEPGREDFTFGGWFTDRALTVPYDPDAPIYADTSVFPLWIPAYYTVGGTVTSQGDPDEPVLVEIFPDGSDDPSYVMTVYGSGESFEFDLVPCGHYVIKVTKPGHTAYVQEFTVGSENVSVDVNLKLYGDVNSDGKITVLDVTTLLKYLAKWDVTIDESVADVNADGKINVSDVTTMLKYVAKWPDIVLGQAN